MLVQWRLDMSLVQHTTLYLMQMRSAQGWRPPLCDLITHLAKTALALGVLTSFVIELSWCARISSPGRQHRYLCLGTEIAPSVKTARSQLKIAAGKHMSSLFYSRSPSSDCIAKIAQCFAMLPVLQSNIAWSMLQSNTMGNAILQSDASVASARMLSLSSFCVVTGLQSKQTRGAGRQMQRKASVTEPGHSRPM